MPTTLLSLLVLGAIAMSGWPWNVIWRGQRTLTEDEKWNLAIVKRGTRRFQEGLNWGGPDRLELAAHDFRKLIGTPEGTLYPAACVGIGHAEYLAGNLPRAISAYRYGLTIDPLNPGLRQGLEFARSRVEYPIGSHGPPPLPRAWAKPRSAADNLLYLFFTTYVAGCLSGTFWLMTHEGRWARLGLICFVLATAAGLGCLAATNWAHIDTHLTVAVITEDGVACRLGNGPSYPLHAEVPYLSRGVEARLITGRGGWFQIELHGNQVGWVLCEKVLVDSFLVP